MSQHKTEYESIPLGKMIFFQNLVPGQQQSQLVNHYTDVCVNTEQNEKLKQQREELLKEYPPILSFRNMQQKKDFYEHEARNCQQFCCGSLSPTSVAFLDDIAFSPKDDYVFSPGNGQLYEGSQKTIGESMKKAIIQEPFGSSGQQSLMTGLKTFDDTVAQRNQSSVANEPDTPALSEVKSISPFDLTPKPKDE